MVARWHFGKLSNFPCGAYGGYLFLFLTTTQVKPGRLGKAAREKAGLERKKCRGKAKSEDKAAQHALADEVLEEETSIAVAVGRWV